jgi:hypothetical protein
MVPRRARRGAAENAVRSKTTSAASDAAAQVAVSLPLLQGLDLLFFGSLNDIVYAIATCFNAAGNN